jgi:type II secretory pathway pseudopilin PulG
LIELLVVVGIMGLVGFGSTTMITTMLRSRLVFNSKAALLQVKQLMIQNIRGEGPWQQTIANNAALNCLIENDSTLCDQVIPPAAPIQNIDIYTNSNGAPQIYFQGSQAARGYDLNGAPCNAYNAAGNDNCPFRYDFEIFLDCPGSELRCLQPEVRINGLFRVSPASATSIANRIAPGELSFSIVRDQKIELQPLEVVMERPVGGGGVCLSGAPRQRPLNRLLVDVGDNVAPYAGGPFRLNPGIYDCEVTAEGGDAPDGFSISLRAGGTLYPIGSGFSAVGGSVTVTGTARLVLNAPSLVDVVQECSIDILSINAMGMPKPGSGPADPNIYTRVRCLRNR